MSLGIWFTVISCDKDINPFCAFSKEKIDSVNLYEYQITNKTCHKCLQMNEICNMMCSTNNPKKCRMECSDICTNMTQIYCYDLVIKGFAIKYNESCVVTMFNDNLYKSEIIDFINKKKLNKFYQMYINLDDKTCSFNNSTKNLATCGLSFLFVGILCLDIVIIYMTRNWFERFFSNRKIVNNSNV